jgi:hypothetical protein
MESAAGVPELYVVYLGGSLEPDRLGEDHEVVLVVADSLAAARRQAKRKWRGAGRAHVDAVARVRVLDGHRLALAPTGEPDDVETDRQYVP